MLGLGAECCIGFGVWVSSLGLRVQGLQPFRVVSKLRICKCHPAASVMIEISDGLLYFVLSTRMFSAVGGFSNLVF